MEQNKSTLAVQICLQIHIHQSINGFPQSLICLEFPGTKSSDKFANISGELLASRSHQLLIN